ncbi:MAG: 50S ribosomal protein L33 [Candidatus Omnitrophica bacterium]|nr:50S ribosomal protein L33 [Candidatus Omnitrophota bacterium]MCB9720673.1 50S ribosomal protein L33 [Candidatus Omnitrophota bacterium]
MAKKKNNRETILLKCEESGRINYVTKKDKKKHPERLELKKYCPHLRKHTLHREVKK